MPEGPEIARAADRIRDAIEHATIQRVFFAYPGLARRAPGLIGQVVRSVRPRGKAMLIRFEDGLTLYSHNQLFGRW